MDNTDLDRLLRYCFLLFLVGASGCGDGRIKTYPTTGTVLVNGKPAEGATVIYCPVGGSEEFAKERPWDKTDGEGKYELTTFEKGDGAPAGDYTVMIKWTGPPRAVPDGVDADRVTGPTDRLKGRYFHPQNSGLTATVEKDRNDIPPFDLELRR
ncbi:MAG: carboxypeptidase regulatory-like domain-containing protein [Bythopirellula sp.]